MQIEQTIQQIINNSTELYNTGYTKGKTEGTEEGYASGYIEGEIKGYQEGYGIQDQVIENANEELIKILSGTNTGGKNWYDTFWDAFQDYGNRKDYDQAFIMWNDEAFKPKYDIIIKGYGAGAFRKSKITDLKGILEKLGVKLDTSENTTLLQMFQDSTITHIPEINATKSTNNNYTFPIDSLLTIDKLIVSETTPYGSSTFMCKNLESIIFEGVIGQNGLDLSKCTKLSRESLISVINCLKDYSRTSTTYTCTLGTTNLAKLTDAEKVVATQKGWTLT